jgi:hypothetical protein
MIAIIEDINIEKLEKNKNLEYCIGIIDLSSIQNIIIFFYLNNTRGIMEYISHLASIALFQVNL